MKIDGYEMDIYAEDDVFETIEENENFREFVGKCVSHFVHFVIPRRDQSKEISQDYPIPESVPDILDTRILLTRGIDNKILMSFVTW